MKRLLLVLCLLFPIAVQAANTTGALTASASSCSATNGVAMTLSPTDSTATIQLSGTFVGTATFTISSNGGSAYTAIAGIPASLAASTSTATAAGQWTFNVAGATNICVYASSYTSGTFNVAINSSPVTSNMTSTVTPQSLTTTSSPTFSTLKLDGATADTNVGTFSPTDPTAVRTWTIPDSTFTVGQIEVSDHQQAAALLVDQSFFVATRAYKLTACSEVHAVAEATAGTLRVQVTKDTSTDAPGAGTDLLTNTSNAGFDIKATANTVQVGTLTATAGALNLATGDRLSVDYTAAATEGVGVTITCSLIPN